MESLERLADAVYALDAIYGIDSRDNYTLAQAGHTPDVDFAQALSSALALKEARFGIPWESFWKYADQEQLEVLYTMVMMLETAGATVVNGTELLHPEVVSPTG